MTDGYIVHQPDSTATGAKKIDAEVDTQYDGTTVYRQRITATDPLPVAGTVFDLILHELQAIRFMLHALMEK